MTDKLNTCTATCLDYLLMRQSLFHDNHFLQSGEMVSAKSFIKICRYYIFDVHKNCHVCK